MDEVAEEEQPKGKPTKDRRDHESWLHDALELSLHHRFQRGKLEERALILHGQRSRSHPDFALLDAKKKLTLVELKVGTIDTQRSADDVIEQMRGYVKDYRQRRLEELAIWYCQHGVDVNARFGYRGKGYIEPHGSYDYGRLNRWVLASLKRYREPCEAGTPDVLKILREDYEHHVVGAKLDGLEPDDRLEVERCILVAEGWSPGFALADIEGAKVELWTYPPPTSWMGPGVRRVTPAE